MNFKDFSIKRFLILSFVFNLPPILALTKVSLLLLPVLFWTNIPVLWTGIAQSMGEAHFKIQEFGALPQSTAAYMAVVSFWLLLAGLVTIFTSKQKTV